MREHSLMSMAAATWTLHRIAYTEWGAKDADRVAVCVHGLSRNGRDFDALARQLSTRWRVVCPDMPGRGKSAWLNGPGPDAGYNLPQYLLDVTALIARLDVPQVDWIGTSMGGLLGMMLAAQPETPIRALVLNDVGAEVPGAFLDEVAGYLGLDRDFDSLDDLEQYLRTLYTGFGDLTEEQWHHLALHSQRPKKNGRIGLAYDPAIAKALNPPHADQPLWPIWESVRCPVLVLRGENSPALPAAVAQRMTETGPRATVVQIPGCGHAPALMSPAQIAIVETWLDTGQVHA